VDVRDAITTSQILSLAILLAAVTVAGRRTRRVVKPGAAARLLNLAHSADAEAAL
jgi:hypothetical protein